MVSEFKDLSKYFPNSDIGINTTQWKQERRNFSMIFLPLELHNHPQYGLQKIEDKIYRLDFCLVEVEDKLVFVDTQTKAMWELDLSELYQSKISLVGEYSKATFVKEPLVNYGVTL